MITRALDDLRVGKQSGCLSLAVAGQFPLKDTNPCTPIPVILHVGNTDPDDSSHCLHPRY